MAAQQNAVDEVERSKELRAAHLLERLTSDMDRLTRLPAVIALVQFDDPFMTRVAEADSDTAARTGS